MSQTKESLEELSARLKESIFFAEVEQSKNIDFKQNPDEVAEEDNTSLENIQDNFFIEKEFKSIDATDEKETVSGIMSIFQNFANEETDDAELSEEALNQFNDDTLNEFDIVDETDEEDSLVITIDEATGKMTYKETPKEVVKKDEVIGTGYFEDSLIRTILNDRMIQLSDAQEELKQALEKSADVLLGAEETILESLSKVVGDERSSILQGKKADRISVEDLDDKLQDYVKSKLNKAAQVIFELI